jgi:4-amino-4-deoxy-L-arabinose transferase-like glycosyltransferase
VCLALTTGLGILTKGTFFVYAPPLLVWLALSLLRSRGVAALGRLVVVIAVAVVALNAGFWIRNIIVFGGPYATSEWLRTNLGLSRLVVSGPGGGLSATAG